MFDYGSTKSASEIQNLKFTFSSVYQFHSWFSVSIDQFHSWFSVSIDEFHSWFSVSIDQFHLWLCVAHM